MRNNVHNVISDAFQTLRLPENIFRIEFNLVGQVGHLLITFSRQRFPAGVVVPVNQCLIKISYEDGEEFSTVFLENNDIFSPRYMRDLMNYLVNHPIDLGNA